MNRKNVLLVSHNLQNKNSLINWTNAVHPFQINIVNHDEEAIELCHQRKFDIVVVDGTDGKVDSRKLHAVLPILQEDITLLRYRGESTDKLEENVKAIFAAKKYKRIQRMLLLEPSVGAFQNLPSFSLN